jgi:hypothetical protein
MFVKRIGRDRLLRNEESQQALSTEATAHCVERYRVEPAVGAGEFSGLVLEGLCECLLYGILHALIGTDSDGQRACKLRP